MYHFLKAFYDSEYMKQKHREFYEIINNNINKKAHINLKCKYNKVDALFRQLCEVKSIIMNELLKQKETKTKGKRMSKM